jgi:DNA-directed RNA polymerase alpha subunit
MRWPPETEIEAMNFSIRTLTCLKQLKIRTAGELESYPECDLLRTPNFGMKSLKDVREILKAGPPVVDNIEELRIEVATWRGRYEGLLAACKLLKPTHVNGE